MISRAERVKEFAKIFSDSRYKAGVSQEYMAAELGVSRKTIQNWESGTSFPNVFQLYEWFRALNLSPNPYLFEYLNSEIRQDTTLTDEEKLEASFKRICDELTISQKRDILYLLTGTYQGDPYAMLQLFVAHAHLPIQQRFFIANQIAETYKMCEMVGNLKDTEYILPDMDCLNRAINAGREAAIRGDDGYILRDDKDNPK